MKDFAQEKEIIRVKLKKHPMNCDQYELMIFDLPPLSVVETDIPASLHKHVAECNSCSTLLISHLSEMKQINQNRRSQPPQAFFYEGIISKMQNIAEPRSRQLSSGNQLLRLSPAFMSAAAAVVIGIWIGAQLTLSVQIPSSGHTESREIMLNAVAEDLQLIDDSERVLEFYLMDTQNTE